MKKILLIMLVLASIVVSGSTREGNISLGNSSFNFEGGNLSIIGSMNITANFLISSNISFFTLSPMNCTNLTGNFITKSLTIGEEEVEGVLDNAIQMTSYDGDFNKLNSSYLETEVTKARFIAPRTFTNRSLCTRIYMGMLAEINPESKWYNFKKRLIFKPLIAYYCVKNWTSIVYCN